MIEHRIPERHGAAFAVAAGERFEVIDPTGGQVADLAAFDRADPTERFSPKYTYRGEAGLRPTTGDPLVTTEGRTLLRIEADDCGVHDLLHAPCNAWIVDEYGQSDAGGCRENLRDVLGPEGIPGSDLHGIFNVFMKSTVEDQSELVVRPPESDPGDAVRFRAERDALVGVAACSVASTVNDGETAPIDLRLPEGALLRGNA